MRDITRITSTRHSDHHTLTVRALYERLGDLIQDGHGEKPIVLGYNYGDFHKTHAVDPVAEAEVRQLGPSGYSYTGLEVLDANDEDWEDDEPIEAVVITGRTS